MSGPRFPSKSGLAFLALIAPRPSAKPGNLPPKPTRAFRPGLRSGQTSRPHGRSGRRHLNPKMEKAFFQNVTAIQTTMTENAVARPAVAWVWLPKAIAIM